MRTIFCRMLGLVTKFFNRMIDNEAERIIALYNSVFESLQDKEGKKEE